MAAADCQPAARAAIARYLLAAGPTAANLRLDGTDGRMGARQLHTACSTHYEDSANKHIVSTLVFSRSTWPMHTGIRKAGMGPLETMTDK